LFEHTIRLCLVDHGRLVRLDLEEWLAARKRLTGLLEPSDDRRLGHRVRQSRHSEHLLAQLANSQTGPGTGNGAARPLRSISASNRSISEWRSSKRTGSVPACSSSPRRRGIGSRSFHASSSPGGLYAPGSLREWPTYR